MFARNCDFSADACSSSICLPAQQLVLLRELGGRLLNLALELVRRLLQLLVEPRLFDRLASVVQDRDDRHQLAVLRQDLAGDRLDRQRPGRVTGSVSWISPR